MMSKGNGTAAATQQFEQMRQVVVEQELSARSWRAMLQKMQDTIEIDRIQGDYDAIVKKNEDRLRAQREAFQQQVQSSQLQQAETAAPIKD